MTSDVYVVVKHELASMGDWQAPGDWQPWGRWEEGQWQGDCAPPPWVDCEHRRGWMSRQSRTERRAADQEVQQRKAAWDQWRGQQRSQMWEAARAEATAKVAAELEAHRQATEKALARSGTLQAGGLGKKIRPWSGSGGRCRALEFPRRARRPGCHRHRHYHRQESRRRQLQHSHPRGQERQAGARRARLRKALKPDRPPLLRRRRHRQQCLGDMFSLVASRPLEMGAASPVGLRHTSLEQPLTPLDGLQHGLEFFPT